MDFASHVSQWLIFKCLGMVTINVAYRIPDNITQYMFLWNSWGISSHPWNLFLFIFKVFFFVSRPWQSKAHIKWRLSEKRFMQVTLKHHSNEIQIFLLKAIGDTEIFTPIQQETGRVVNFQSAYRCLWYFSFIYFSEVLSNSSLNSHSKMNLVLLSWLLLKRYVPD